MSEKEKKEKKPRFDDCRYNLWVACEDKQNCKYCGWNPDVAKDRIYWRRVSGATHITVKSAKDNDAGEQNKGKRKQSNP